MFIIYHCCSCHDDAGQNWAEEPDLVDPLAGLESDESDSTATTEPLHLVPGEELIWPQNTGFTTDSQSSSGSTPPSDDEDGSSSEDDGESELEEANETEVPERYVWQGENPCDHK